MAPSPLDTVDLEIQWQRLISFLAEAALTVVKTSFSKIVSEGGDFGCLLYDREGRMVAQDAGVSSKLAPSPRTVLSVIRRYPPDALAEGDVLITNDPWLCCGHLYDISVIRPLFHAGALVGFAECLAHVPDVGGSVSNDSRQVYEEGLCLPVVRLIAGGEDVREVFDIIRSNVRVPDQLEGDIRAFVAALDLVQNRVAGFLAECAIADLQPLTDQIIARSEAAMRASIREIPDGVYRNRIALDGVQAGGELAIEVAVRIEGDGITVDYDGTDPQSPVGINCTEVYTQAWTLYAVRCIVAPTTPYNHGLFVPVRVLAPAGSFLNAQHPSPVRMKSSTGNFIPFAVFGAMAEVVPERVMAESGIKCVVRCFGTSDDGRPLAETPHFMGGLGARYSKEGIACMSFPAAGAETPVEMIENSLPVTVLSKRLVPDSGGPGRHRGGAGQEIVISGEARTPITMLIQNMKVYTPTIGYAGGAAGLSGCNRRGGELLPGKATVSLERGQTVEIRVSGGGGMFDPLTRPEAAVLEDVANGLVSREGAARDYGVVLRSDDSVDRAATDARRARSAA